MTLHEFAPQLNRLPAVVATGVASVAIANLISPTADALPQKFYCETVAVKPGETFDDASNRAATLADTAAFFHSNNKPATPTKFESNATVRKPLISEMITTGRVALSDTVAACTTPDDPAKFSLNGVSYK